MIESGSSLMNEAGSPWSILIGEWVVIDLSSPFVYLGRLMGQTSGFVSLDEADAHDLRDTSSTRERYVLHCRLHGIRANRRRVWIRVGEIVGISRLEDVIVE